jgi:pimeloyl-ACP methyl ester carboxylesterase
MTDLVQPGIERSSSTEVPGTVATTTSRDGTCIAYERVGAGPALVLVDGALGSRRFGPNAPLPPLLAEQFTVYHYDRRGRGESGDTQPYTVDRELEDLAAVIDAAGGRAHLYGVSSGALLALDAARRLPNKIDMVVVYEPPCVVDDSRAPYPSDYAEQLAALVASDRRGDAVKLFMRKAAAMPAFLVILTRVMPAWSKVTAASHTLVYDAHVMGDTGSGKPLSAKRFSAGARTLVVDGGRTQSGARCPARRTTSSRRRSHRCWRRSSPRERR